MTIEELKQLSSQDMRSMKKRELIEAIHLANIEGERLRTELRRAMNLPENRNVPTPAILREGRVGKVGKVVDWSVYSFEDSKMRERKDVLRNKLTHLQQFITAKSSTWSGWIEHLEDFSERVITRIMGGEVITRNVKGHFLPNLIGKVGYNRFFKLYNRVEEYLGDSSKSGKKHYSESLLKMVYEEMMNFSYEDDETLVQKIKDRLDEVLGIVNIAESKKDKDMESQISFFK